MAITPVNIGNNSSTLGVATNMANALKVFSGQVLTAFERKCIGVGMVTSKSIASGSSAQFPVIARSLDNGDAVASYVVGTDVSTQAIPVKERVITIGAPTYYALSISRLEEKVLHLAA